MVFYKSEKLASEAVNMKACSPAVAVAIAQICFQCCIIFTLSDNWSIDWLIWMIEWLIGWYIYSWTADTNETVASFIYYFTKKPNSVTFAMLLCVRLHQNICAMYTANYNVYDEWV